ncbi:MAG: vitamin B12 dependent methionine synthase [Candidatus Atribacteria bacterium]|nr:vitamin B12 dependent methionine synthase [Candidatus Atribacteria bacterium]
MTLETIILSNIPFQVNREHLADFLHLSETGEDWERMIQLVEEAERVGRPQALYGTVYIDEKNDGEVVIEGIHFTSRVLRVNVDSIHKVFPFVATCGQELDEWSRSFPDLLDAYWLDMIKEMILREALVYLENHLHQHLFPGKTSTMNPGSLPDWPITEQKKLFELMGNSTTQIGVGLTESCLMIPIKSVSGIIFPTESRFENCQLCPRQNCPGRRAPYEKELSIQKFHLHQSTP